MLAVKIKGLRDEERFKCGLRGKKEVWVDGEESKLQLWGGLHPQILVLSPKSLFSLFVSVPHFPKEKDCGVSIYYILHQMPFSLIICEISQF